MGRPRPLSYQPPSQCVTKGGGVAPRRAVRHRAFASIHERTSRPQVSRAGNADEAFLIDATVRSLRPLQEKTPAVSSPGDVALPFASSREPSVLADVAVQQARRSPSARPEVDASISDRFAEIPQPLRKFLDPRLLRRCDFASRRLDVKKGRTVHLGEFGLPSRPRRPLE